MISFPNRVWERTANGWASRPVNPQDTLERGLTRLVLTGQTTQARSAAKKMQDEYFADLLEAT